MEKEILLFKNNRSANWLFAFYILTILLSSCTYRKVESANPCENVNSKYAQGIAPLIQTRCAIAACHNGDGNSVGNFNNYAEIKLRVDNGQFKLRVIDARAMPPVTQPSLTSEEFIKLKCWFDAGGPNN